MKRLIARNDSTLADGIFSYSCTSGKGGRRPAQEKTEGDGASPIGSWALKRVYYRPDRIAPPETKLPVSALTPDDGWCDDPTDANYNRPVKRPYAASHEHMWRDDHAYDVVVEIAHNDDPPIPGLGSAIFIHVAHEDRRPTEGCIALALNDLLEILKTADTHTHLVIEG
ncbi:MAG: L,D-transpeptidase family protein [Pseudomonadota bacterium]